MYESMVRPHFEYASQVWDPHLQKDINLLEGVQKIVLRMCSKDYNMNYEDLLQSFELPELSINRDFISDCH